MHMKIKRIAWLDKPKKQKKLTATLGSNKKLLFSDELYERLPERVRFGFDSGARALVIAKSEHDSDRKHKNGTVYGLTEAIRDTRMKLPVCFEFEYDGENEMWVGEVVLRKRNNEYDMEQFLALYKPVADKLFNRIGKTTPKEDRRQIIALAFCEAAKEYTAACGNIETYITKRATEILKQSNMLYVKHSRDISMDADIKDSKNFNMYAVKGEEDEGYFAVDEEFMEEQFEKLLSDTESMVLRLLKEKFTVSEISDFAGISQGEVVNLTRAIANKRKQFFESV